jgi:hypothetical protein
LHLSFRTSEPRVQAPRSNLMIVCRPAYDNPKGVMESDLMEHESPRPRLLDRAPKWLSCSWMGQADWSRLSQSSTEYYGIQTDPWVSWCFPYSTILSKATVDFSTSLKPETDGQSCCRTRYQRLHLQMENSSEHFHSRWNNDIMKLSEWLQGIHAEYCERGSKSNHDLTLTS